MFKLFVESSGRIASRDVSVLDFSEWMVENLNGFCQHSSCF